MFGRRAIPQAPWQPVASRRSAPGNRDLFARCLGEVPTATQVEHVSPSLVVIRVFDKLAVDLTRLIDRLGDYSQAVARCDDCLRNEVRRRDEADFTLSLGPWY